MLLAQTRQDRNETRARHSVCALNMKYTLEFVFITLSDANLSTYKNAATGPRKHTLCDAVLSTYKMAACAHARPCI